DRAEPAGGHLEVGLGQAVSDVHPTLEAECAPDTIGEDLRTLRIHGLASARVLEERGAGAGLPIPVAIIRRSARRPRAGPVRPRGAGNIGEPARPPELVEAPPDFRKWTAPWIIVCADCIDGSRA